MTVTSAGLLLYRRSDRLEVLLAHMGGPFWRSKDDRAWSIPKGEYTDEDPLAAAEREFAEELGAPPPPGATTDLGWVRQSGKAVRAFARESDFDADRIVSNTFTIEWPPRSGRTAEFPEVDRAAWFDLDTAQTKLVKGQVAFLPRLTDLLSRPAHLGEE